MKDRVIIGGHTRYAAAKQLGMEFVPYLELNHLDDMDVRKYRLADNRVSDESEWDKNLLRNELAELELNSKLDAEWWKKTGFNQEEIAKVLAGTLQEVKEDFKEVVKNPKGNYYLYRVGDAISSRNIHAAIYDSLRICKNI